MDSPHVILLQVENSCHELPLGVERVDFDKRFFEMFITDVHVVVSKIVSEAEESALSLVTHLSHKSSFFGRKYVGAVTAVHCNTFDQEIQNRHLNLLQFRHNSKTLPCGNLFD